MCYIQFIIYFVTMLLSAAGSLDDLHEAHAIPPDMFAHKKRLLIDTDAGADDGVAILNILGAEEKLGNVGVELITCVNGNTNVDNVAMNVLKILKTVNRLDIPVHKGANQSLLWTPKVDNYFGEDGFGDFPFENPPPRDLIKSKHAVIALIEMAALYPGQLSLVCLGPLTNIALAVRLDNNFLKNLKEVYILGGSDSGVGNMKSGIEFNFYVDPESATIVFKEAEKRKKILNLVPWETAAIRSLVPMEWRKKVLGTIESPQIDLINNAERLTLNKDKWISSDTILSSVVIDSSVVESSEAYHVDVEVCGRHSRAAVFIDYASTEHLTKNVRIIKRINVDLYKKMLLQNLGPKGSETNGASRL